MDAGRWRARFDLAGPIDLTVPEIRHLLATLLLSQGVPMLLHGDELGRTQQGNNNTYAQDNELSWVHWDEADPPLLDEWVAGFAQAAERAAGNAVRLAEDIAALDEQVREELVAFRRERGLSPAVPRRDAAVLRILDALVSDPVLTAESVSAHLGVSPAAAHRALTELAEAGILGRAKEGGRLICWTADRHLALVALTERSNRVGGGLFVNRNGGEGLWTLVETPIWYEINNDGYSQTMIPLGDGQEILQLISVNNRIYYAKFKLPEKLPTYGFPFDNGPDTGPR